MGYRGDMSRVEVIVEYGLYTRELLRFKRWLVGWLYDRYGMFGKVVETDDYIIFEVEGDVFELFNELRTEVKLMLRDVKAGVEAFGVCGGDECIVVDDFRYEAVLDGNVIKRLNKVVNRVMHIAGAKAVEGIKVVNRGGFIVVYMDGCCAKLYVNEAFIVGVDLAKFVESVYGLEIVGDVGFVYDVFELPEPRSLAIDFITDEGGIILFVDDCSRYLNISEALRLAYWLMRLALNEIELQKMIEEGHE
jgi:hypothetical protein